MKKPASESPAVRGLIHKIASILLQYPDQRVYSRLDDIAAALEAVCDTGTREQLAMMLAWLRATPPGTAAQHHVATFDLQRRCSPYLTYYRYGDTRQRGMALLALKQAYRRCGFEPAGTELPDYLPAVLEFAALAPHQGRLLLTDHRPGLELLLLALRKQASPYAAVLDAICRGLPALSDRQAADVRRLIAEGPPREEVGLDPIGDAPFAPPEFLTGTRPGTRR